MDMMADLLSGRSFPAALETVVVVSDALFALACLLILIVVAVFTRHRGSLPPPLDFLSTFFVAFMAVGALAGAVSLVGQWLPLLGLEAALKLLTSGLLLVGAIVVLPLVPRLLALPSPAELERSNEHLKGAIQAHIVTMKQLNEAREQLESKVAQRTRELTETNQRFEAALAGADIAVFTQDRDLVFTWCYDPRLLGNDADVVGQRDDALVPPEAATELVFVKNGVLASGKGATTTVFVETEAGGRYLRFSIEPLRGETGEIVGLASGVVDLTERHDYETRLAALTSSLAEANARFDLALRGSAIVVFSQDEALRYTWIYNLPGGLSSDDFLGKTDAELFDQAAADRLTEAKRASLDAVETRELDVSLTLTGRLHHYHLRLEPILSSDGHARGIAGVALDMTQTRLQEAHLRLVMRELTHRSKNLLAVIQAMARQTAARSDDPQTFVARFSARLRAMAASHDLLVAQEWHGAVLSDLVAAQIAQAVDPGSDQVSFEGPQLSLKPDAVQNIGLALHELTTNAAKYGALSVSEGRIALRWSVEEGRFHLVWRETGGPPVVKPARPGFGVTLLERTVGQALDGEVRLGFEPAGVVCEIDIPASHVIA